MILLAIDTTAEYGSIALIDSHAGLIEELPIHAPDGFGQLLLQAVDELLKRHSLRPSDIACYAGATGPGSFTGVRICLAAVKGLAESTGARVAGVSNLRAIASYGQAHTRASIVDARRGEIYGAVYDSKLHLLQDEIVAPLTRWLDSVPVDAEFVAQEAFDIPGREVTLAPRALAGAIGQIALTDGTASFLDPAALDANYVRRSDAELMWKEA